MQFRTGNRLYQQLCELVCYLSFHVRWLKNFQNNDPEYAWVARHTWQSWRERYKKNSARLDGDIEQIVQRNRPAQGENGQYGYVRQTERRGRKKREWNPEKDAITSTNEVSLGAFTSQAPSGSQTSVVPETTQSSSSTHNPDHVDEWAVKVGQDPIPIWGKRKANSDTEDVPVMKRQRIM